ncbi:hypothetical protein WMY93_021633 [Mugilogobius chulae]|uniref:C-type lectin domain-containing protein n=1 Tax=Mugilogobius chulae TaxID=88201 RepID=A0AAW0NID6_9GOBI
MDTSCVRSRSCFICYNESSNATVFTNAPKKWLEAQQFCRANHADLMSGLDQQRQFITSFPHRSSLCWIGLSRDTWGWSDESDSSFRNWNTFVNPNKQKCAALIDQGLWEQKDCTEEKSFICYDNMLILVKEKKTWEEAFIHCRRNHRDLVWSLDHTHLNKMAQVRANMSDTDFVWVGLHYVCALESWIWVNGNYVDNADDNWKEPGKENDCGVAGAMAKGGGSKWVKELSGKHYNFICVR